MRVLLKSEDGRVLIIGEDVLKDAWLFNVKTKESTFPVRCNTVLAYDPHGWDDEDLPEVPESFREATKIEKGLKGLGLEDSRQIALLLKLIIGILERGTITEEDEKANPFQSVPVPPGVNPWVADTKALVHLVLKQDRAPKGGVEGMNGEWYEGGQFLPSTDLPKKERERREQILARAGEERQVEPTHHYQTGWGVGGQKLKPPIPGVRPLLESMEVNPAFLERWKDTPEGKQAAELISRMGKDDLLAAWKLGARWRRVADWMEGAPMYFDVHGREVKLPEKKGIEALVVKEWDESKHPRDEKGRFTEAEGELLHTREFSEEFQGVRIFLGNPERAASSPDYSPSPRFLQGAKDAIIKAQAAGVKLPKSIGIAYADKFSDRFGTLARYSPETGIVLLNELRVSAYYERMNGTPNLIDAPVQREREGFYTQSSVFLHELMHAAHHAAAPEWHKEVGADKDRPDRESGGKILMNSYEKSVALSQVSTYAAKDALEFVAEVAAGLIAGRNYSEDVLDIYRKYHGPTIRGKVISKATIQPIKGGAK